MNNTKTAQDLNCIAGWIMEMKKEEKRTKHVMKKQDIRSSVQVGSRIRFSGCNMVILPYKKTY
jgi:hypothetical protein